MRYPRIALAMMLTLVAAAPAAGHETDQFTLPAGREFADLDDHFAGWIYDVLHRGVDRTNQQIRTAIEQNQPAETLARLQEPDEIVAAVNREFPWAMDVIEGLERDLHSTAWRRRYPGKVVGFKEPFANIMQNAHFILDPRQLFRIWLGSTFKLHGVYLGTDKIGHFTDMGMNYYRAYAGARRQGQSDEQATRHAIQMGTQGLIFSERGMLGYLTAGAYSNADLAANYLGFLFYRNLTEPVRLKGVLRPPLLERDGPYWKLAGHVRPDSDFFAWFISDHLNEALNPSLYEPGMRSAIRRAVRDRAAEVLDRYRDAYGRVRPPEYFNELAVELSTYYGVDYGHQGKLDELVTIGKACYDESARPLYLATGGISEAAGATDASGRTLLHLMALDPRRPSIAMALEQGADVEARDHQGRTPLHAAAEAGNLAAARELIERGADVKTRDRYGATPLHLAAAGKDERVVRLLIEKGADVSAADDFGCVPLHDAARAGTEQVVATLLRAGANARAADDYGTTPLHLAARHRRAEVASALMRAGADVKAANAAGATPLHESAAAGARRVTRLLLAAGAPADARDRRGRTASDLAAANGSRNHAEIVQLLRSPNDAMAAR